MTDAEILAYNAGRHALESRKEGTAAEFVANFYVAYPDDDWGRAAADRLGLSAWHRWAYRGALDALLEG